MALKQRGTGQHIRVGDMTHQVDITTKTMTDDGQGGRTSSAATTVRVWANLIPINAGRAQAFGLTMNNKPHEIDMLWYASYVPDENDKLVVVETSQVLYVHSVINVDKKYQRCKVMAVEKK